MKSFLYSHVPSKKLLALAIAALLVVSIAAAARPVGPIGQGLGTNGLADAVARVGKDAGQIVNQVTGPPVDPGAGAATPTTSGVPAGTDNQSSNPDADLAAPTSGDLMLPAYDRNAVARYPGQPLYTKLRLTLDSQVAWAAAELTGVGYVIGQAVEGGPAVSVLPNGVSLSGPGRAVVDLVLTLPESDVEARICKASGGTATLTVTRLTGAPSPAGQVVAAANDDVVVLGCANRGSGMLAAGALAPAGAWPVPVDDRRLVLSFFYPWWNLRSFDSNPYLDIPLLPFDTESDTSLVNIINLAKSAGIDGFVESYQRVPLFEGRFAQLVAVAERVGNFTVAPQLELVELADRTPRQPVMVHELENWFRNILESASSPAFLKVAGRPVIFMFRTDLLTPGVLGAVRGNLRASGLPDPYIIGDALDLGYALDGFYTYTPNVQQDTAALPDWYWHLSRTTRFESYRGYGDNPALLVSPVSPGEDDTRAGGGSLGLYVPRLDGARYDASWGGALATRPDWVVVSTWNAFPEDTQITPGQAYGRRALEQTAHWARLFHAG